VLLYFTENALTESELCMGCSMGGNFVSSLISALKSKKTFKKPKNLKTFFSKKPRFCALFLIFYVALKLV